MEFDNQKLIKTYMEEFHEAPPEVGINGAHVIRRQYFSHMKDWNVTFRPNGLQFNTACINFFEGVTHILLMVDWDHQWFIIKPCDPDDKDGQHWCTVEGEARKTRMISGKDFAERFFKKMDWCKGKYYRVCGTLARQLDTDDELIMVFELKDAEDFPMTRKSRQNAGVDDEEIKPDDLERLDEFERQKELEKQERARAKVEGRETKRSRKKKDHFPESWGDSLGVRYDQHQTKIEFPHLPSTGEEVKQMGMDFFNEREGDGGDEQ